MSVSEVSHLFFWVFFYCGFFFFFFFPRVWNRKKCGSQGFGLR
jgi:hypothetical protein